MATLYACPLSSQDVPLGVPYVILGAHELPYAATMWPLFTATSFTADLFLTVKAPLCHEIVGLEKDQKVLGFILG